MKRIIFILFAFMAFSCDNSPHIISGTLSADKNGEVIYLKEAKRRSVDPPIDSAVISGNKFNIGAKNLKGIYTLELGGTELLLVVLDAKPIKVDIDLSNLENNSFADSEINNQLKNYTTKIKQLEAEKEKIKTTYNKALEDGDDLLLDELESEVSENDSMIESTRLNFINENPDNIVTAYIVSYSKAFIQEKDLKDIYNKFGSEVKNSIYGKNINETIEGLEKTAIGKTFPDLEMKTPEGADVSLSAYAGKGKYVLVNFWASWCPYCRKDNPQLVNLYENYKEKGFEIVGVSLDRYSKNWKEAINEDHLTWPQISDIKYWESSAMSAYGIRSLPFSVLVDGSGKIVAKGLSSNELERKLEELLPKNNSI